MVNPSRSTVSVSSLLCQESETSCEEQDEAFAFIHHNADCFSDESEYVFLLMEKEKENPNGSSPSASNLTADSKKVARLNAVNCILSAREVLGFELQTAYLSVTYLDRFLSLRKLDDEKPWAMQLLAVGCLSLATKMQESSTALDFSSFPHDFNFDSKAIQRMELLILCTFEWKMGSVIPFAFLHYFISTLFTKPPASSIIARILELIMGIVKYVSLVDYCPSAIALAAVFLALDQNLTRDALELKINAMPCSKFLDIVDVFNCYTILQKSEKEQSRIPKLQTSSELSPLSILGFQYSPSTSSVGRERKRLTSESPIGSKRKRLTFDDAS